MVVLMQTLYLFLVLMLLVGAGFMYAYIVSTLPSSCTLCCDVRFNKLI